MDGGNKVIDLPQKQKVLLKGLSKLGSHNFKFESKLDFISLFSDDTMPMTTELENLIYCTSQKDADMYFENEVGILGNFV